MKENTEQNASLADKFQKAHAEFNKEEEIKEYECKQAKTFVNLVLEKIHRHQYMELTYLDCGQNALVVLIGKGWVGTKTPRGELTFELVSNFNPCVSRKEYKASALIAAIRSPDRARVEMKNIRRHEFNSCYYAVLDSFLSEKS